MNELFPEAPPASQGALLDRADQAAFFPKTRAKRLKKLEQSNGLEYAIVRNQQIQIGKAARDYLKAFATYVGSDGKASKSALDKTATRKNPAARCISWSPSRLKPYSDLAPRTWMQ